MDNKPNFGAGMCRARAKEAAKRYLILIVGLFINAIGINLITNATLGTSPITSVPYTLALRFDPTLGEFTFTATSTEGLAPKDELFADTLQMLTAESGVKRLMVVPDETQYNKVREILRRSSTQQAVTAFAMQPMTGGPFMQEILGYSLMAALGIRSDEIKPN